MIKFNKTKCVDVITIEKEIVETDIETIIVGAFEGGSNYWMGLDVEKYDYMAEKPEDEPWSTWCAKLLLEGKEIKLYGKEEEMDDSDWILTLNALIKGIQLNYEGRPHDTDIEYGDANTYDVILQYALFEEIVFG